MVFFASVLFLFGVGCLFDFVLGFCLFLVISLDPFPIVGASTCGSVVD